MDPLYPEGYFNDENGGKKKVRIVTASSENGNGPYTKECRGSLEAGKSKKGDSPLDRQEATELY